MRYAVGCDLGQAQDPTVIVIVRCLVPPKVAEPAVIEYDLYGKRLTPDTKQIPPRYDVVHVEAVALGTEYPEIAETLASLLGMPELGERPDLVIDATGVGRPVVDMLRRQMGRGRLRPITLTAGNVARYEAGMYYVPKVDVIKQAQLVLEYHRITFVDIPETAVLIGELRNFKVVETPSGHDTYNAARGAHDDHVIALALAVWWFERYATRGPGVY